MPTRGALLVSHEHHLRLLRRQKNTEKSGYYPHHSPCASHTLPYRVTARVSLSHRYCYNTSTHLDCVAIHTAGSRTALPRVAAPPPSMALTSQSDGRWLRAQSLVANRARAREAVFRAFSSFFFSLFFSVSPAVAVTVDGCCRLFPELQRAHVRPWWTVSRARLSRLTDVAIKTYSAEHTCVPAALLLSFLVEVAINNVINEIRRISTRCTFALMFCWRDWRRQPILVTRSQYIYIL